MESGADVSTPCERELIFYILDIFNFSSNYLDSSNYIHIFYI